MNNIKEKIRKLKGFEKKRNDFFKEFEEDFMKEFFSIYPFLLMNGCKGFNNSKEN